MSLFARTHANYPGTYVPGRKHRISDSGRASRCLGFSFASIRYQTRGPLPNCPDPGQPQPGLACLNPLPSPSGPLSPNYLPTHSIDAIDSAPHARQHPQAPSNGSAILAQLVERWSHMINDLVKHQSNPKGVSSSPTCPILFAPESNLTDRPSVDGAKETQSWHRVTRVDTLGVGGAMHR